MKNYETKNEVVYGLIKGRHEIPVDKYIFETAIEDVTNTQQMAEQVYNALKDYNLNEISLRLYVTGLTVALVEVIKFCLKHSIPLVLMHYDVSTQGYFEQITLN